MASDMTHASTVRPEIRVLHFIDTLGIGGKERQFVELAKGLCQDKSIEQLIVCMDKDDFYRHVIDTLGIRTIYCFRRTRWDPSVFYQIYLILKRFQPNIIHTNSMMTSFYALPLSRMLKIKVINGSIRNAFSSGGIRWRLERYLINKSDIRVANSRAGLDSRGLAIEDERNFVIYNGFDWSRITGTSPELSEELSEYVAGKKVVGMIAEFSDRKDYKSYLIAAQEILKNRSDVVFIAVGDGKNFEASKSMISGYSAGIRFLGKRKDVENIIPCFDIGVLSTFSEGISNSVMEYMAFGKPVVVTNGGGSNEIVLDGETGFLIPPNNPQALASKIEYLLDNPDDGKAMGDAGKKRIEEHFSLQTLAGNTVSLYKAAIRSY